MTAATLRRVRGKTKRSIQQELKEGVEGEATLLGIPSDKKVQNKRRQESLENYRKEDQGAKRKNCQATLYRYVRKITSQGSASRERAFC